MALTALRALFMGMADDDEGGNKLAQLPDYDHENNIVIPAKDGFSKIPLPFGLIRLANGLVNNALSYSSNEKTGGEAISDFVLGTMIPSFAPISESPMDGTKFPIQKAVMTVTPPILKPVVQAGIGLTPFGAPLQNPYAEDDKFISDQPKLNTPEAYTEMAQGIRSILGIDVAPEVVREIIKGYPLGVGNYIRAALLDEKSLAAEMAKPYFAPYPDAARYFQFRSANSEATTELMKKQSRDKDYDRVKIKWLEDYKDKESKIQGQMTSAKRSKATDEVKAAAQEKLRAEREVLQNEYLYLWRKNILKAETRRTK